MAPPIRLPSDRNRTSPLRQSWQRLKQVRGFKDFARWSTRSFRLAQLPLRIRPAMILGTFLALLLLSMLGFHPTLATHLAPPSVPFSDKVLHFVCFGLATALFYACWVVEESARRVTFWRYWNETVSLVGFTLIGGIGSEFVQALLPYKTFQIGDVLANLLGSGLAVVLMHHYSREARRAAELRRLYVHLDQISPEDEDDDDEDDDEDGNGGLGADDLERRHASEAAERGLLRHSPHEMQESRRGSAGKVRFARVVDPVNDYSSSNGAGAGRRKQALDPWSATEDEIFGLGGEDDDDDEGDLTPPTAGRRAPSNGGPL
ncbi:hypothetical protein JCM10908_006745 [Rhodotorula pacifica]|uniref:uncharacterized protein n=1 Tax=Rhodotorula pacifica TaxID=1495444 RepID=UPI003171E339